jgi:hypothetical protein
MLSGHEARGGREDHDEQPNSFDEHEPPRARGWV